MAVSKLLFLPLLLFVTLVLTTKVVVAEDHKVYHNEVSESSLKTKLDQLNSNISILESRIDGLTHELKHKDENIEQLENIIQEKSTTVNSLKSEVQLLQERGSLDAKYEVVKAYAQAGDLEKKVDSLKNEIDRQAKKKAVLESRASLAEKKFQDLNLKLESLQRIYDEQKSRISKTERAVQMAEEELVKSKLEVADVSKEVREVRESWLPPWLAVHLVHAQSFIITQWNEHGRPYMDVTIQKALQEKAHFENWVKPHIDLVKTQWIPTVKAWWFTFVTNIEPSVKLLAAKTVDVYRASKNTIRPYIFEVQKTLDPYYKEAEKFTKPYVNQVSTMMKPHVDKAHVVIKPYTKKVVRGYKKFMKAVATYHRKVRAMIHDLLKSHKFTKQVATSELIWYMASALMALPVIILFNLTSAVFSKKPKKRSRHSHSSHTRRRVKRVHHEK